MPPFSFLTAIIISGPSKARAESYAINLAKDHTLDDKISILGPVEAPLFLLRGQYRYRLLLKANSRSKLNNFTKNLFKNCPIPPNLRLIIDVDPHTFV
jgi:primosomal protein N' (replication factor Y)